mmetsp:Transcript_39190/g.57666  ORF Transcript_39190/g.57666 Transcript_39190/m.57666 type:complete len:387 (+) Transcript_39190:215-1375(+)
MHWEFVFEFVFVLVGGLGDVVVQAGVALVVPFGLPEPDAVHDLVGHEGHKATGEVRAWRSLSRARSSHLPWLDTVGPQLKEPHAICFQRLAFHPIQMVDPLQISQELEHDGLVGLLPAQSGVVPRTPVVGAAGLKGQMWDHKSRVLHEEAHELAAGGSPYQQGVHTLAFGKPKKTRPSQILPRTDVVPQDGPAIFVLQEDFQGRKHPAPLPGPAGGPSTEASEVGKLEPCLRQQYIQRGQRGSRERVFEQRTRPQPVHVRVPIFMLPCLLGGLTQLRRLTAVVRPPSQLPKGVLMALDAVLAALAEMLVGIEELPRRDLLVCPAFLGQQVGLLEEHLRLRPGRPDVAGASKFNRAAEVGALRAGMSLDPEVSRLFTLSAPDGRVLH